MQPFATLCRYVLMVVLIQSELSASISEQSDDVKNLYEVRRGLRGGGRGGGE